MKGKLYIVSTYYRDKCICGPKCITAIHSYNVLQQVPSKYTFGTEKLNSEGWISIFTYEYYKSPILWKKCYF